MKAYLWHEIGSVSNNYHSSGSVLIEAASLEEARSLANITDYNDEIIGKMSVEREPDLILESNSKKPKVWVFPDSGCC